MKKPLNVLLYSKSFYPTIGGLERTSETLAKGLSECGASVVILTETDLGGLEEVAGPFQVVRTHSAHRLRKLVAAADIVHVNGFALRPFPACLIHRKPMVVKHAGFQAVCMEGTGLHGSVRCEGSIRRCAGLSAQQKGWPWALRRLGNVLLRRLAIHVPSFNVAVSSWQAARLRLPRTHVIWNPVSVDGRTCTTPKNAPGRLSFFGRLVTEKGVDVLLRAVALLRSSGLRVSLDVYGDGPERIALEALAGSLGIAEAVSFLGPVRAHELAEAQARAWVIVVPSTNEEPMGIVAVEAMAAGAPLVVSRSGGLAEVSEGCALTFENGSDTGLAHAISELLGNESEWNRLASAGPTRARIFEPRTVAQRYLTLYETAAFANAK